MFKTKHDDNIKQDLWLRVIVNKKVLILRKPSLPVSSKDSLHIIMAIVSHFDLELHQMDVRTTLLNGDLVEDVHMSQPIGFEEVGKEHMVCKL